MAKADISRLSGARKAAILLTSLDQEVSALAFSKMGPGEIESVSFEIARMEEVSKPDRDAIIEEYYNVTLAQEYISKGGFNYAKSLLERSMPPGEAQRIIESLESSMQSKPFQFLVSADPDQLLTFIQDEHPQTIALIITYLNPQQSAEVLSGLPPEKQIEVVKRIANMENTNPDVIKQVERSLETKLSAIVGQELQETGGVEAVAEVLNLVDRAPLMEPIGIRRATLSLNPTTSASTILEPKWLCILHRLPTGTRKPRHSITKPTIRLIDPLMCIGLHSAICLSCFGKMDCSFIKIYSG